MSNAPHVSKKLLGRIAGGAVATAALVGFGAGVAQAEESAPSGTIQEVGGEIHGVEKSTGIADATEKIDDATGVTTIDKETGVTKLEEDGLGLK